MKTCIAIPMKDPEFSKQRLSPVLDSQQRQTLALALFRQTLRFLNRHFPETQVLVVTASERIAQIATSYGAAFLIEEPDTGLNGAAELAARWSCPASDGGTNALLTTPPDVVPFRFGIRSSRAHLAAALERSVPCALLQMEKLTFDLDTPDDLQLWTEGMANTANQHHLTYDLSHTDSHSLTGATR